MGKALLRKVILMKYKKEGSSFFGLRVFLRKAYVFLLALFLILPLNIFSIGNSMGGGNKGVAENPYYSPGEIIIKLKEDTGNTRIFTKEGAGHFGVYSLDELGNKYGLKEKKGFLEDRERRAKTKTMQRNEKGRELFDFSNTYKLTFPENVDLEKIIADYEKNEMVEYVHLNYRVFLNSGPDDPEFIDGKQWGLEKINAPDAWGIETGSSDIVIAVLDTGIDYEHEDLADNMWTDKDGNHGYDFADDNNDPMDVNGHGTHVAGIASAVTNNNTGIAGVSWNSKLMAVKIFKDNGEGGTVQDVVSAIEYAVTNEADILSNSWGFRDSEGNPILLPDVVKNAIDDANDAGCLVVFAAGNENSDNPEQSGNYEGVITVGGTDENDEKVGSSSYGEWVDVSAPGINIYSTLPDDKYGEEEGTSMAAPFVSGLAALIWSYNPELDRQEVWDIIVNSADNIDAENPGYEGLLGSGRINAYNALRPVLSIDDFSHQLTDEKAGHNYGEIEITVSEVSGLDAENVNISFEIKNKETQEEIYNETETRETIAGNGSEVVVFDINMITIAGQYDAMATATATNASQDAVATASFNIFSTTAASFDLFVDETPLNSVPVFEIENAIDIYENILDGDYDVSVLVMDSESGAVYDMTETIGFSEGLLNYEPSDVTPIEDSGTYTGKITIDGVEKTTEFEVVVVPVESIVINEDDQELMEGDELQLTFAITPESASDKSVFWESSDSETITVTEEGLVTALKREGSSVITVTTVSEGFDDSITITAVPKTYTVTFTEQNNLEDVSVYTYSDSGREEVVGSTLFTASSGTAAKELEDGEYWFKAKKTDYDDYEGDFTVEGDEKTVEFTMSATPAHAPPASGGGRDGGSPSEEENDNQEEVVKKQEESRASVVTLVKQRERLLGIKSRTEAVLRAVELAGNKMAKEALLEVLEKIEEMEERIKDEIGDREEEFKELTKQNERLEQMKNRVNTFLKLTQDNEEVLEALLSVKERIELLKKRIQTSIESL